MQFVVTDINAAAAPLAALRSGSSVALTQFVAAVQSAGVPVTTASLTVAAVTNSAALARTPPPPAPPPLPPGQTPGGVLAASNAGKHNPSGARAIRQAVEEVAGSLAALVVLWVIVHAIVHAVTTFHLRRTSVTVALLVQCGTSVMDLHSDAKAADAGHDEASMALHGKRFKAPHAVAALAPVLRAAAVAACASQGLPAEPKKVAFRPLRRGPLLAARGVAVSGSGAHDASGLALKRKPQGLWRRLKRAVLTELRWQAAEMHHLGRALRRCFGHSRTDEDAGRVFRLVPAHTDAVRDAAGAVGSLSAPLAAALVCGTPAAVLVEVAWYFGYGGGARDAACAWRAALRTQEACAQLEAAITSALVKGEPVELTDVHGLVACALLDDAAHAALDKKRSMAVRRHADAVAATVSSASDGYSADARSYGLEPAVAARLGAVLLLSLKASGDKQGVPVAPTTAVPAPETHDGELV